MDHERGTHKLKFIYVWVRHSDQSTVLQYYLVMILSKGRTLYRFVRSNRDIFKDPPSTTKTTEKPATPNFTQPVQQIKTSEPIQIADATNFPYKFGGIKSYPLISSILPSIAPKQTVFLNLYKNLLQAIMNRDQKAISEIVEPSLVKPLLAQKINTKYIGQKSEGKVQLNRLTIGIGVEFNRTEKIEYATIKQQSEVTFYRSLGNSPIYGNSFPVLYSYHVTIFSKARLIQLGAKQCEAEEAHSLVFQIQAMAPSLIKIVWLTLKVILMKLKLLSHKSATESIKQILCTQSSQWKVGNLDSFLKERV